MQFPPLYQSFTLATHLSAYNHLRGFISYAERNIPPQLYTNRATVFKIFVPEYYYRMVFEHIKQCIAGPTISIDCDKLLFMGYSVIYGYEDKIILVRDDLPMVHGNRDNLFFEAEIVG